MAEVSSRIEEILNSIGNMTVLELSELIKAMEEKFGVSPMASVAMAPSGVAVEGASEAKKVEEEKTQFDVILVAAGEKKIPVIKEVRTITGLGLKEAKALVEEAPKPVKEKVSMEEAESLKAKLEAVGAQVEIK